MVFLGVIVWVGVIACLVCVVSSGGLLTLRVFAAERYAWVLV